jgi:hypothetical protein
MTRPPLYVRRPFLAGLLRQLPLLAVLIAVGVGLLMVTFEHWRKGLVVVGLALVGGAVLRAFLPVRRVRSRPSGRPTVIPRPTTTTSAPAIGTS